MATTESAPPQPSTGPPGGSDLSVDVAQRDDVQKLKPHALGLMGVLFIALAGAAPMSAMLGNVPIAVGSGNGTAAPGGFILAAIVLTLFSVGYVAMARQFTTAGGFYGFISHGLGRPPRWLPGGQAWPPTRCSRRARGHLRLLHPQHARPVPAHQPTLAVLRLLGAGDSRWAHLLRREAERSYPRRGAGLRGPAASHHGPVHPRQRWRSRGQLQPLEPDRSLEWRQHQGRSPRGGDLLRPVVLGRFRMHGQLCQEARNPRKMVPRATYIAVLSLGVLFTLTAWSVILGHGLNAASDAYSNAGTFFFGVTGHFVSPLAKDVMEWLIITSTFASAMAFHAAATRYFYAMGREGILNRWLGKTHKRWQSPYAGSFFQSGVAAVLVTLFIIMWYISKATQNFSNFQTAPYAELYGWLSILGTFWVLVMMTLSGIATIRYFGQEGHRELEHWGKWLVAPALASLGMAYALYLLWANIATLGGGHINIIIALPWVASAWFLIGLGLSVVIKRRNPKKYEVLGRMLSKGL